MSFPGYQQPVAPWPMVPTAGAPMFGPAQQRAMPGAMQPVRQPNALTGPAPTSFGKAPQPVWPGFDDCFKTLRELLKRTIQVTDLAAHLSRGFNARTIYPFGRVVLNLPTTFPGPNAAGTALGIAEGPFESAGTLPVLVPGTAGDFASTPIVAHQAPPGFVSIFTKVGVTVEVGRPDAVRLQFDVNGGPNLGSSPPNNTLGSAQEPEQLPTLLIVPDGKTLNVRGANLDLGSPILVTVALSGWNIPIRQFKNTLASLHPQLGYGACGSGDQETR